jgi:hypothetical protein
LVLLLHRLYLELLDALAQAVTGVSVKGVNAGV